MLNEDALLLFLVVGACALVVLGTLELLWPTRPRYPRRRPLPVRDLPRRVPPPRPAAARRPAPPPWMSPFPPLAPPVTPAVPTREVETRIELPNPSLAPTVAFEVPEPVAVAPTPPASDAVTESFPSAAAARSEPAVTPTPEGSVVERGLALLYAQRLDEVVALAQRALNAMKSTGGAPLPADTGEDAAGLWGLMGLAKHSLNDLEGARFAFEEAIAAASGTERATWEGHLVSLTLAVGRRTVTAAATASGAERVASLTSAIEWLERGLAVSPNDTELHNVVVSAREALWVAHEAVVNDLLQRHETAEARRVLEVVIADPECPPDRRLAFCRLLDGVDSR